MLSRSLTRPHARIVSSTTLRLLRTSAPIRRAPFLLATSYHHPLRSHVLFAHAASLHIVRPFSSSTSDSSTEKKPSRWEQLKGVLRHYWSGSKLLAANVSTAAKLVRKSTLGKKLTRRERRLLTLTAADLARLVPFAFFIIVPFMELLLPFALMLFPNMLPSTFEDKNKKEEKMKKQLTLRMEMAQFLQETTEMMAKDLEKRSSEDVKEKAERFVRLLQRVREGKYITNDDLHELASLFQDDFTLEHLSRDQLLSLCRYMGIPAYGRNSRLQYELIKRLEEIRDDDRLIIEEGGVSTLTLPELRAAVQHRGMQALGVEEHVLKEKLQGWLDLSLNQAIPPALLILSRIFTLQQGENPANLEMIKDTLANLDDKIVEEALDDLIDDNAQKLEDVKFQLELLKEEEADEQSKAQQEKEKKDDDDDEYEEAPTDTESDKKARKKPN